MHDDVAVVERRSPDSDRSHNEQPVAMNQPLHGSLGLSADPAFDLGSDAARAPDLACVNREEAVTGHPKECLMAGQR